MGKRAILAAVLGIWAPAAAAGEGPYPWRWFYVSRSLARDGSVDEIRALVETASRHDLNGMVLAAGFDRIARFPERAIANLRRVKAICDARGVEIIPLMISVGYGGALGVDPNLAAGLPVRDALFVAREGEARLVQDPPIAFRNGGFEAHRGDRFPGYDFIDGPGRRSFADGETVKEGRVALRMEHFGREDPRHGHARVMQTVAVRPHRRYRIHLWVKTEGLEPAGAFRILALAGSRSIAPYRPRIRPTQDWTEVGSTFNSLAFDRVRIYAGLWGGKGGRVWIDGVGVEEIGLSNVLRRPGTPVRVRGEASGIVYEEGRDYAPIRDPRLHPWRPYHADPPIRILPGARITEGERLRVSFYHPVAIHDGQVTLCMSEPKLYAIYEDAIARVTEILHPRRYFLSMDEIRAGGSCEACRARGISMGEILGDCVTRVFRTIRRIRPDADVLIWSDMLDPNHNAHGDYYLVEGDFTGSWEHVPRDLVLACWYYDKRDASLRFFSGRGHRTVAAAYYDGDDLTNPEGWLRSLDAVPRAQGIIYTTWRNRYELLAPFGDLAAEHRRP